MSKPREAAVEAASAMVSVGAEVSFDENASSSGSGSAAVLDVVAPMLPRRPDLADLFGMTSGRSSEGAGLSGESGIESNAEAPKTAFFSDASRFFRFSSLRFFSSFVFPLFFLPGFLSSIPSSSNMDDMDAIPADCFFPDKSGAPPREPPPGCQLI